MEELHNTQVSHEIHDSHNILVNPQKLSRGLTRTFEGISIIFESLGSKLDVTELSEQATRATKDAASSMTTAVNSQCTANMADAAKSIEPAESSAQSEQTEISEHAQAQSPEPATASKSAEQTEQVEPTKSSITLDDITKVIVEKIKQDRGNREKIEAIVHEYGVSVISQLGEANYEAFMAELASL